ncbi:Panacea domain-containing protein [Roseibium sp.]|uniref:Panacea domain-containing protein n=1 Tax=Roseibium sp. TaxID=1936156 RepID=UPI003D0AE359
MYNPRKAAQAIAFFALKTGGDAINVLKAVKLVFLADRENIRRFGFPILDERRVSMRNGPVNSRTYSHIQGEIHPDYDGGWSEFLTDRENHNVGIRSSSLSVDNLDELSDAELNTLESVWESFGDMSQWDLVKFTHDTQNVPEWQDPTDTGINSKTITLEEMMAAIGVPEYQDHAAEIDSINSAHSFLKSL